MRANLSRLRRREAALAAVAIQEVYAVLAYFALDCHGALPLAMTLRRVLRVKLAPVDGRGDSSGG